MRVTEAVVISLPQRTERLERLKAHLPGSWPFPALRVQEGIQEAPPPYWRASAGAWGCRLSHLNILQSAWDRGVPTTLVLEDDAVFMPGFADHWADLQPGIPPQWSMIMLGGQHLREPQPVGRHLVRCVNTRRTHAYIINLKAIPLLMRTWSQCRNHIDHALADFQTRTGVYAPARFLIGQDAGWSDISAKDNAAVRFWA